jgi:glycosyltransferase involved in cell wall biosynthesis
LNIQFDAHVLMDDQKTGIGRTALKLIEGLALAEKRHTYVLNYFAMRQVFKKRDYIKDLLALGCKANECRWFNSKAYKLLYNFIPIPYSLFFGGNADITHFMNYHVPPGVKGKVVTMVYDTVYKAYPETMNEKTRHMLDISMKRSCRRADAIVTISEFSKSEIIKYLGVPSEKVVVMPCGVDFSLYRPDYGENEVQSVKVNFNITGSYLLYLGTLEPRKNIERLIEAYSSVRQRVESPPELVIAGRKGWHYGSIFKKTQELGLTNDIIFTGYVDEVDAPVLMKGAIAFVFPSIYEGFGLPPLEAMACGTPVITSNVASLPEVTGDAALLIDPFSVDAIADAIERIINDKNLRAELSQKGIKHASQYSWDNSVKIISDLYDRLASN